MGCKWQVTSHRKRKRYTTQSYFKPTSMTEKPCTNMLRSSTKHIFNGIVRAFCHPVIYVIHLGFVPRLILNPKMSNMADIVCNYKRQNHSMNNITVNRNWLT